MKTSFEQHIDALREAHGAHLEAVKEAHMEQREERVNETRDDIQEAISDGSVFGQLMGNTLGDILSPALEALEDKAGAMKDKIMADIQQEFSSGHFAGGLADIINDGLVERAPPALQLEQDNELDLDR